ncbi:tRNA(Ile)-lysidine synthetase [Liberibacter crescens]|nr:tRNA(Ile)-lysidine synthetase [Liberibacter crescens]
MFLSPIEAALLFVNNIMPPLHILVAVSGGSDSVGLLVALHSVLSGNSFKEIKLSAVTINHGLRKEAHNEALYVSGLCYELNIAHRVVVWKEAKPHSGLMVAAREARYKLLSEYASSIGASLVVVGHTFDDQLETVRMRSTRDLLGEGIGLAGICDIMLYNMSLWVCRPFLKCRRESIRSFLKEKGIIWCNDSSNFDSKFERVRFRLSYSEESLDMISKRIDIAQYSRIFLGEQCANLVTKYLRVHLKSVISISREVFSVDHKLVAHLIRVSAAICSGYSFLPGYQAMNKVMLFLKENKLGCISVGNAVLDLRRDTLWITRALRNIPPIRVLYPGESVVWDGRLRFINSDKVPINICPGLDTNFKTDLPNSIKKRACASIPRDIEGEPSIALFSRFLVGFDFPLTCAFYAAFGLFPFPKSPFRNLKCIHYY